MQTDGLADELAGLADELAGLAAKATKGNLATASKYTEECIECPVCGDGEVDAADYCNFDDKALGVQFYGIGDEFGAHEKLWSAVMQNFDAILAALRQHEQMREALGLFTKSAYPVCASINPRGHNWCEAYLDEALKNAVALATKDSTDA
jgi:hypothetical protein